MSFKGNHHNHDVYFLFRFKFQRKIAEKYEEKFLWY